MTTREQKDAVRIGAALFVMAATLVLAAGGTVVPAAAAAVASPPPDAVEILWADYCGRTSDARCQTPTPSVSVAPSPTPTPTPAPTPTPTPTPAPSASPSVAPGGFILIAQADLLSRPTTGAAWSDLVSWSSQTPSVDLGDLNSTGDVVTLAKALVHARTGDVEKKNEVISALKAAQASRVTRALELARGLGAYVLAADLIGYRDPAFVTWAKAQRTRAVSDGPKTLDECAQVRPNNWGTWCRSSRLIVDLYTGDSADVATSVALFRGWLGERAQYAGFSYGDLSWQCDSTKPVGINPQGCTKSSHSIDGVLPDDQRRAGSFSWPPPCENYVAEALQGTTLEATVLTRAGYPAWSYSDSAIRRATDWKYANGCPFIGDDSDIPFVIDAAYGTSYAGSIPSRPGKGWGFADWLFP